MGKKHAKKLVITAGILGLMMFTPTAQSNPLGQYMNTITNTIEAQAAETYSDNWKIDSNNTWWYYMEDGSVAKNAWIHDHGEWYLLGEDGAMRTGIFESNDDKYYLLDTVRGTGYYGRLLKNGDVYEGITLKCDTSAEYEGALSQETINALRSLFDFGKAPSVKNTKHVENGKVTFENNNSSNQSNTDMVGATYGESVGETMSVEDSSTPKQGEHKYINGVLHYYDEIFGWVDATHTNGYGSNGGARWN